MVSNFDEYSYNLNPFEDNRGLYETQYEYDDAGQVILTRSIEVKQDGTIYVTESQTVYDILGRQIVQRQLAVPGRGIGRGADDSRDRISLTQYDSAGQVKYVSQVITYSGFPNDPNNLLIDPNDIVTENVYDSLGRLVKVINPEGYETSYTYTLGGQVKTVTDPNGNVTTHYYDESGRLERMVDPLGHSQTFVYDSLGQTLRQVAWEDTNRTPTDPNDDTPLMQQWYAYDSLGHVIRQALLADPNSPFEYIADPNTDKVTDFVYDGMYDLYPGQLVAQTIYYGGTPATAATTTFDYDSLGRRYKTTDPAGNQTLLTFDLAGRVKLRQQTDLHPDLGADLVVKTEYQYDNQGRLWKLIADPNNFTETQTTEYAYGLSWRVKETQPNGVINTTEYDAFGEKIKQVADAATGGIKQTTEWSYDRAGRLETITGYVDESNPQVCQTTTYDYDKLGNVKTVTYPDTKTIQYVYNDLGRVKKRTDQRGLNTYYLYNPAGNLTLKTNDPNDGGDWTIINDPNVFDPNAVYWAESFSYDGLGRQLTAVKVADGNEISRSVFAYTPLGLLAGEAQTLFGGATRTAGYGYDQYGYRTSTSYPDGSTVIGRSNTWDGRIETLSRGQTNLAAYAYQGTRTSGRAYNTATPVVADYAYDNRGRLTDIAAGSLVDFHYDYVQNENNIWKKGFDHRGGTPYNEYSYDNLDRLTQADYLKGLLTENEVFAMDDLGNRNSVNDRSGSDVVYSPDALTNRYTSIDAAELAYDAAGNLTTDKDNYVYKYDYENRIEKIEKPDGQGGLTLVAAFDYDTDGRRIRVYDAVADTTTLYYYSDNWQVLAEYDASNNLQAYYVYGNYIDEALLMHRDTADRFYLHDHLYSPVALLDASGDIIERYEYDAYGNAQILTPGFSSLTSSQYGNRILFTGREVDTFDSGSLKMPYHRNRYLSHFMGCWYSPDPLGYVDGMNLYEYVKNNCILYCDPYGLESLKEIMIGKLKEIDKEHSPYQYYDITGLNQLINNRLIPTLQRFDDNDFKPNDDPYADGAYHDFWNNFYLNSDVSPGTVFHEAIHAYNDLRSWGAYNARKDEALAYGAGYLLSRLNSSIQNIENELDKEKPSLDILKSNWKMFWYTVDNLVVGMPIQYYQFGFFSVDDDAITEKDVSMINSELGFKIKCSALAGAYNAKLGTKLPCSEFKCTISAFQHSDIDITPFKNKVFE